MNIEGTVREKEEALLKLPLIQEGLLYIQEGLKKAYPKLAEENEEVLPYHNVRHAKDVLCEALLFALTEGKLSDHELELLAVAAIYHDAGYVEQYEENESVAVRIVSEKMQDHSYSIVDIERVSNAILSTRVTHKPFVQHVTDEPLGKYLADADVSNFGRETFDEVSKKVYAELEALGKLSEGRYRNSLDLLKEHKWHTDAAKRLYEEQKQRNIAMLEKSL